MTSALSDLGKQQREELVDDISDTMFDACDMDVGFSQYAEAVVKMLEKHRLVATRDTASQREKLAAWMIDNDFVTGHGDTMDDLLGELSAQVKEVRSAAYGKQELARAETARLSAGLIVIHEAAAHVAASVLRGIAYDIALNRMDPETARFQITVRLSETAP